MAPVEQSPTCIDTDVFGQVEIKKYNQAILGLVFEDEIAIALICSLLDNQGLVKEMKLPDDKFNDIVIKEVKRDASGNQEAYSFYQLKHKAKTNEMLTWNHLIDEHKDNPFFLGTYFKSYMKLKQAFKADKNKVIKELCIITTSGLSNGNTAGTDLTSIVRKWANMRRSGKRSHRRELMQTEPKNRPRVPPVAYITDTDVERYFSRDICRNLCVLRGNRYRFSKEGIEELTKCLSNDVVTNEWKEFLSLLVLHVSVLNVNDLKESNNRLLRLFFPFHYSDQSLEKIKKALLAPFKVDSDQFVFPVTVRNRKSKLEELRKSFQTLEPFQLDSSEKRSSSDLSQLLEFQYHDNISPWAPELIAVSKSNVTRSWSERQSMSVLNIYTESSNLDEATLVEVITLKVSSFLRSTMLFTHTNIIRRVKEETMRETLKHFDQLNEQVLHYKELITESFSCVIEAAPGPSYDKNIIKQLAEGLAELKELRKWIQFIIVTQSPIPKVDGVTRIHDTLKWEHLDETTKNRLFEKELFLVDNRKTSLKKLGFEKQRVDDWLNPRPLAELIIHDEEKPFSLGLPKKDYDLETEYIKREIQLPLIKIDEKKGIMHHCAFNEEECSEAKPHLLTRVKSERYNGSYLWKTSKRGHILELKQFIVRSKDSDVTEYESKLLEENVNFGTGSKDDNKLVVVVDLPGKGKSFLISNLSNTILDDWDNQSSHPLILKVNLRDIKDWHENSSSIENLLNHSLNLEGKPASNSNHLNFAIMKEKCMNATEPSVFVLLDGYDEIGADQRKITLDIVDHFKKEAKGVKRIILTSRPEGYLEDELEKRFHQLSLHLKNFDKKEQISYLTRRWNSMLKINNKENATIKEIGAFAGALVDFAAKNLRDEGSTLVDIPLQCWIFSECFFQDLKQYLEQISDDPASKSRVLGETFDEARFELVSLYNRFYDVKISVLLRDKAGFAETNEMSSFIRKNVKKSFLNTMRRLSIIHMMKDIDDAQVIGCMNWDAYRSEMNVYDDVPMESDYSNDLKRAVKLGFVKISRDEESLSRLEPQDVTFLHRTFAEYFFAIGLLENFIRKKSELLDDNHAPKQGILDKSFELIMNKIFVAEEFAGVRRFFDRMLAKRVPPIGERCPFASGSRENVLKKWPAIGHETFNNRLAGLFTSQASNLFETWLDEKEDTANWNTLFNRATKTLQNLIRRSKTGIAGIWHGFGDDHPSTTLMLIHDLKEHACRSNASNNLAEIENLVHCVALTSFVWVRKYTRPDERRKMIITSFLHFFDRVPEASEDVNNVLSKCFFRLIGALIGDYRDDDFTKEALALSCEMLKHHQNFPKFQDYVHIIVMSVFRQHEGWNRSKADQFFRVNWDFLVYQRYDTTPEAVFGTLQRIIGSLGDFDFIRNILFENLAAWFVETRLTRFIASKHQVSMFERFQKLVQAYRTEGRTKNVNEFSSDIDQILLYLENDIVHPFAFKETVKILMKNESYSRDRVLEVCSQYIIQVTTLLMALSCQTNGLFVTCAARLIVEFNCSLFENIAKIRVITASLLFQYLFIPDEIISYFPDLQLRIQAMLNVFSIRFDDSSTLSDRSERGFCFKHRDLARLDRWEVSLYGVLYRKEMPRKTFDDFYTEKLAPIWERKGLIEIIDFSFEDGTKPTSGSETGVESNTSQTEDNQPREIGSYFMEGMDISRIPCSVPERIVNDFIQQRRRILDELEQIVKVLEGMEPQLDCPQCQNQE